MFFVAIGFVIVGSAVHIAMMRRPRNLANILETVLSYVFVFFVALSAFVAFLGHTFRADEVARQIGWSPGSPFQSEVAMANLVFAVLGVLTIWFRGNFWLATAIGYVVFMMGAGFVHIRDLAIAGNRAPLNAGAMILTVDLVFPAILLLAVIAHQRLVARSNFDPERRSS